MEVCQVLSGHAVTAAWRKPAGWLARVPRQPSDDCDMTGSCHLVFHYQSPILSSHRRDEGLSAAVGSMYPSPPNPQTPKPWQFFAETMFTHLSMSSSPYWESGLNPNGIPPSLISHATPSCNPLLPSPKEDGGTTRTFENLRECYL